MAKFREQARPARKQWEYTTAQVPSGEEAKTLTELGRDGWEVVPPLPDHPIPVENPGGEPSRYLARIVLLKREVVHGEEGSGPAAP